MRLKNCVRVPWKEGLPCPCGSGLLPTFFPSGWSVAAAILPTVLLSLVCEQGHGAKVLLGKERLKGFVSVPMRSKIDRLQVGPLQSGSLHFAFPEIRHRWAPVEEFTTSLLFALRNGSDNRNRINSQSLSLVNTSRV